jgi:hypothetical protein
MINIVGREWAAERSNRIRRHGCRGDRQSRQAYPETIVAIKTAHYNAPEWVAVDRAITGNWLGFR